MVLGALGKLTGEAVRNLARNLFPGFYERGISANQALSELRQSGLGYRRRDFLNDFRIGESSFDQASKVKYVGEEKTPSEGILEPLYHGVPDKYSFVYKATGTDLNTNEPDERYFFMHRQSIDTRGNMEEEASSWYSDHEDQYQFSVDNVQLVEGYINPVWA